MAVKFLGDIGMKRTLAGLIVAAATGLAGCTTAELEAFSYALSEASYDMQQSQYGSYYGPAYQSPYQYQPSNDLRTGYNQCVNSGSLYRCDTNGDGYADMFGNTEDGSMTSASLKVNGRGEGFTWDTTCSCWQRNRAYDTGRRDDHDGYHGSHLGHRDRD